jgi:hypothetical protein
MAAPDAERRLDEVATRAKQDISRARSSAVILAFMAGAAALIGAIAAWAAAVSAADIAMDRRLSPRSGIGGASLARCSRRTPAETSKSPQTLARIKAAGVTLSSR